VGKQCRERWFNHLDPAVRKGDWTVEEDRLIWEKQQEIGNKWCAAMYPEDRGMGGGGKG
jgi:hypothetical protein